MNGEAAASSMAAGRHRGNGENLSPEISAASKAAAAGVANGRISRKPSAAESYQALVKRNGVSAKAACSIGYRRRRKRRRSEKWLAGGRESISGEKRHRGVANRQSAAESGVWLSEEADLKSNENVGGAESSKAANRRNRRSWLKKAKMKRNGFGCVHRLKIGGINGYGVAAIGNGGDSGVNENGVKKQSASYGVYRSAWRQRKAEKRRKWLCGGG